MYKYVNASYLLFVDNTLDVYEGLYVIGSSIIPCDIHGNPAFTECMLAERCMRLCAADFAWRVDYVISENVVEQLGKIFNLICLSPTQTNISELCLLTDVPLKVIGIFLRISLLSP